MDQALGELAPVLSGSSAVKGRAARMAQACPARMLREQLTNPAGGRSVSCEAGSYGFPPWCLGKDGIVVWAYVVRTVGVVSSQGHAQSLLHRCRLQAG